MNAVQPRTTRRWSSRLNSMANNATGQAAANSNITSAIRSNSGPYPAHCQNYTQERIIYEQPGVCLRPLPFYDHSDDLIRPAGLMSDGAVGQSNESRVEFKMTIDQANMVAMSTGSKRILLRFCYLDDTQEQDDNFPYEITVAVNGQAVALPPAISNPNKPNIPPKRPGQHVDITKECKLCPYVRNVVEMKWFVDPLEPSRSYVITVIIAEKVDVDTLLRRIQAKGESNSELTKRLILDSDNEVATTNIQYSLVCPLGKMRMSLPCKSVCCQHIPCFDALLYLQMNERKASWICPVCDKSAHFRDLMIDGFFMDIIKQTAPFVTEVTLNSDGSWKPVIKMEQPTAKNPPPEVITISDEDD